MMMMVIMSSMSYLSPSATLFTYSMRADREVIRESSLGLCTQAALSWVLYLFTMS